MLREERVEGIEDDRAHGPADHRLTPQDFLMRLFSLNSDDCVVLFPEVTGEEVDEHF